MEAIYGIPGVHAETIEALNRTFQEQRKPGHYAHVLRDLCNIETCLVDTWTFRFEQNDDLIRQVWQAQNFINPSEPDGADLIPEMERKYKVGIRTLEDWLSVFELELDDVLAGNNMRVLKTSCAYWRNLYFADVDHATAKSLFTDAMKAWYARGNERTMPRFPIALQDYLMHHLLKLANDRNLTLQIHTGLFDRNEQVRLSNGDPTLMDNLFTKYPDVDFDLFHIGYPFQAKACALCKMFPNVYIDMCWAHIVSPAASMAALDDFLDAIPYTKVSAFGGDYLFADGIYGHLELSRQNISAVLAGKVERGIFTEDKAVAIGKALYYDNPKRIMKL